MLLACSGVVFGATVGQVDRTDSTLKSYFDFSSGNTQTAGSFSGTWNELMAWNEEGEYGTAKYDGTTNNCMATPNGGLGLSILNGGVTISFDVKDLTKTGTLLTVMSGSNTSITDEWKAMKVDVGQNENSSSYTLSATIGGKTINTDIGSLSEWTTLTFVANPANNPDSNDKSFLMLDIYVNGAHAVGYEDPFGATNFVRDGLQRLQFGYWGNANNATAVNVDNILIYDRALSATEVKALTVPEPTTATLSLLALAGLAARRRRK